MFWRKCLTYEYWCDIYLLVVLQECKGITRAPTWPTSTPYHLEEWDRSRPHWDGESQTDKTKTRGVNWCKQGSITSLSSHIRCKLTLCRLHALNVGKLAFSSSSSFTGRSASGCSCCAAAAASATPAPLFPRAHMSNTSPHTCPCITIWLLNPHQRFLEALFSLSLTSCLWRAFFSVFYLHFLYFFIPFFFCPTSLAFFLSSSLLSPSLRQCDVCRDRAPGTLWVMPDVRCGIRRLVKPRRSPPP